MTRPWRGPVHAIGTHSSRSGPGFVIHRTRNLPPEDVTTHWGIPVTTPLRTLLDLSSHLSLDALDAALAEALVRKLVPLEDLQARATGRPCEARWPPRRRPARGSNATSAAYCATTACRNRPATGSCAATRSTSTGRT